MSDLTIDDVFCPECGKEIIRLDEFRSCPDGHGRLKRVPPEPIKKVSRVSRKELRLAITRAAKRIGRGVYEIEGLSGRWCRAKAGGFGVYSRFGSKSSIARFTEKV